jgi:hypothetical protein
MLLNFSGKPIFRTLVTHHRLFNMNAYNFGVIKQFRLPDLGESKIVQRNLKSLEIKDATVKKWRVKEGDMVEEVIIVNFIREFSINPFVTLQLISYLLKFHPPPQESSIRELFLKMVFAKLVTFSMKLKLMMPMLILDPMVKSLLRELLLQRLNPAPLINRLTTKMSITKLMLLLPLPPEL